VSSPEVSESIMVVWRPLANENGNHQLRVEFINSYISLENLRHNQSDIIDFAIQGNINGIEIIPLLFLPLIENTFKHALHEDIPNKWVKLVLSVDKDELIFQASNPKSPSPKKDNSIQNGIVY
jgi:two-component system LytT family sensor kinase